MPSKRYSPAVSVRALRFKPVPWLTIVMLTSGTTAPLGSATVPETVASWVCDDTPAAKSAARATDSMQGRYRPRFAPGRAPQLFATWTRLMINSVLPLVMATFNLEPTAVTGFQRHAGDLALPQQFAAT